MADVVALRRRQGARESTSIDDAPARANELSTGKPAHKLDSAEARAEHRKLLQWYYYERDRQAANRLEMAIDHDFYDGEQWSDEDRAVLDERNQMALVFNEIAPMVDWLIGTQRRAPVDWGVFPRAEDDVKAAEAKAKWLKYVSDVNKVPHHRSRAFADAIKGGIGWLDDGVRDDPTKELLYSRYEDWRCVLHDSSATDLMGEDSRYLFRWRWVDEDIALAMFPDRADVIRQAIEDQTYNWDPMESTLDWNTPDQNGLDGVRRTGTLYPIASSSVGVEAERRRVKLIECQYRKPVPTKYVSDGPLRGVMFDERDRSLAYTLGRVGGSIVDRITMRMHVAVFTEAAMLAMGPSAYRHNQFSLTPVVCFRNGRTRQPYGYVRRVRDIQQDLNKRISKSQFLLNTNQIVADEGAVDDLDLAAEEMANPQGRVAVRAGKRFEVRRDSEQATGQLQLAALNTQSIQRVGGVPDENMGRKTNAVSGEAIKARQTQGSVVTTEPFDNLRLSVQVQGEKQLSLSEQFVTEERVVRITGVKGKLEWLHINRAVPQADGSIAYQDDITASVADFIVAEADYAGTLRQAMFESMNQLAQRLPPEVALRFLRIAFEYSDLPNKEEIVAELRKITGEQDPNKPLTPEEAQAAQAQMQAQNELMQLQRAQAVAALEEQQAKAQEVKARAEHLMAQVEQLRMGGDGQAQAAMQAERAVMQVREQLSREIESLTAQLRQAQADTTTQVMKIRADADTAAEVARIKADGDAAVAEIQAASDQKIQALLGRIEDLTKKLADQASATSEIERMAKEAARAAEKAAQKAAEPAPAAATAPAPASAPQPTPVIVAPVVGEAKVAFEYGPDGKPSGATLKRADGSELKVQVDGARKPASPKKD